MTPAPPSSRRPRATRLAAIALVAAALGSSAAGALGTGAWLDGPLAGWNHAGAALPGAPAGGDPDDRQRCASVIRAPASPTDRVLAAAGWSLAGPVHTRDDVAVLLGHAAWDGMCRPWAFQVFAFVGGRFAGTLAPGLMDARTDGAWQAVRFESATRLDADYVRYVDADPLCCPSRISTVRYRVETAAQGPVVVPIGVSTRPSTRP